MRAVSSLDDQADCHSVAVAAAPVYGLDAMNGDLGGPGIPAAGGVASPSAASSVETPIKGPSGGGSTPRY